MSGPFFRDEVPIPLSPDHDLAISGEDAGQHAVSGTAFLGFRGGRAALSPAGVREQACSGTADSRDCAFATPARVRQITVPGIRRRSSWLFCAKASWGKWIN